MENKSFHYEYSAPTEEERKQIESIRKQYQAKPTADNKLERLKALHAQVKNGAMITALTLGIVGTIVFGAGLAMVLEWQMWLWGVLLAAIGGGVAAVAYPVYKAVLKRNKEKYGAEILKLSQELLDGAGTR